MPANKKRSKKKAAKKKRSANTETSPASPWTWVDGAWCLPQQDSAAWVGVSVTMFRRYEIKPHRKVGRTVYYSETEIKSLIRKLSFEKGRQAGRSEVPQSESDLNIAQARAQLRLTEEQGESAALKNSQLRRELAPVQILQFALGQLSAQVAALLDPLPGKIRRRQPKLSNADVEAIRHECVKAQNVAAELEIKWDEIDTGDSRCD